MRVFRSIVAALTSVALGFQLALPAFSAAADFAPDGDDAARRCDAFEASRLDSQYRGPRTPITEANLAEALSACAQAASASPGRPRYQYLYGQTLWRAQRHAEAAQQYALARRGGYAWGAKGLGFLNHTGLDITRTLHGADAMGLNGPVNRR